MMSLHRSLISLIIALGLLIVVSQSVAVVQQGQIGVRLRANSVTDIGLQPGLHFRLPFIGRIVGLDDHWITLDSDHQNGGRLKLVSSDGKNLEAGYAAIWQISDPATFCRVTGCDESSGARRINDALTPMLDKLFAAHTAAELLADKDAALTKGLPAGLTTQLQALGVKVQAVYITALTLPHDQLSGVYERMRTVQSDKAAQIRAQGTADADAIRNKADQQRAATLAQADIQAQKVRGDAQAEATAIYARAYAQDPEFFNFYMRLQAYKRTIKNDNSVIVLGPDSGFLKYFDGLKEAAKKPQ
ncbi:MAG: protease modulator HflC [Gammaproteobacteria bacterium]